MNINNSKEQLILQQAIAALSQKIGLQASFHICKKASIGIDGVIKFDEHPKKQFGLWVKLWTQKSNVNVLIAKMKILGDKYLLITDYVNPNLAETFREHGVGFIDAVGNAYINTPPLYVFVKGNKRQSLDSVVQTQKSKQTSGRAFRTSGIKVLYALMRDPELLNKTYREIATAAGISLGSIGLIFEDLKQSGFLTERKRGNFATRILRNNNSLYDKWVFAYTTQLRPKLFLGRFDSKYDFDWKDELDELRPSQAKWGGEVGVSLLDDYLTPGELTIYLPEKKLGTFLKEFRMHRSEGGKICLYNTFQSDENMSAVNGRNDVVVDPMIIFADLLTTTDPRNLEAAWRFYKDGHIGFIEKN